MRAIVPVHVERKILVLRGERVMLDADLAELYEVETRSLIQAVKCNAARFPADFMFQLTTGEVAILRSQTGISSAAHGGRRYAPYAFTEHGVAMLSSVLRSRRAVQVSIEIVRAFVRLRAMLWKSSTAKSVRGELSWHTAWNVWALVSRMCSRRSRPTEHGGRLHAYTSSSQAWQLLLHLKSR